MLAKLLTDSGVLTAFLLAFFRIAAFIATAPILSNNAIPMRIKTVLGLLITLIVIPLIPVSSDLNLFSISSVILIIKQIIIGVSAGFVFKLIFEMIVLSGQVVAYQTGLGFANLVNPQSNVVIPMVSQIYLLAALLLFLALNGHLLLIQFLVKSFYTLPLSSGSISTLQIQHILDFSKILFSGAVTISLPAIISILIVNFTFAVMTSSAPQLNVFNIGFPITLVLGLFIIYISFTGALEHSKDIFHQGFDILAKVLSEK